MTARSISKPLTRNLSGSVLNSLFWTPRRLFQQGQQGVWYEPRPEYLYQDSAGTEPVTADGQPVGLMLDRHKGLELGPEEFNGDFSQFSQTEDGWTITTEKLACDGVDSLEFALSQAITKQGAYAEITFTVSNYVSGDLYVSFSNGAIQSAAYNANGTYTLRLRQTVSSTPRVYFRSESFSGEITHLSVKEITGNHATQETASYKPIYRTDGTLHWLDVDGVDDHLLITTPIDLSAGMSAVAWISASTASGTNAILSSGAAGYLRNTGSVTNIQGGQSNEGINTLPNQAVAVYPDAANASIQGSAGQSALLTTDLSGLSGAEFLFAFDGGLAVPWVGEFSGCVLRSTDTDGGARGKALNYLSKLAGG